MRFDYRFDYFNQDQLRSGTGTVNRPAVALPTDREIQQATVNRNSTLTIDYSPNQQWGYTALLPYFDRYHTTVAPGDTDISTSQSSSIGDVRLLARYQAWVYETGFGVQFGVKLPTGRTDYNFKSGPQADTPLDRGLQPGTGTTDLLAGLYKFGDVGEDWNYFAQGLVQQPLNSRRDFRPGTGLNLTLGVRYTASETVTPHLQINVRTEARESGFNADVANSGATLAYLSPGVTIQVGKNTSLFGFMQVPVYQRVNGYQLEPRFTISVGIHYAI